MAKAQRRIVGKTKVNPAEYSQQMAAKQRQHEETQPKLDFPAKSQGFSGLRPQDSGETELQAEKRIRYTEEQKQAARDALARGMSVKEASLASGISYQTTLNISKGDAKVKVAGPLSQRFRELGRPQQSTSALDQMRALKAQMKSLRHNLEVEREELVARIQEIDQTVSEIDAQG